MAHEREIVSEVKEQLEASRRWFDANYYGELAEIYRNIKCRVQPIKDPKTNKEDKTRTNICLPDHFVMVRRGTARLTVNPPNLKVRGGQGQGQRDLVSALLMGQWDRSTEQRVFRQVVHQAKAFGWSVEKTYWDKVKVGRVLRRRTERLNLSDILRLRGQTEEEIQQAVESRGGDQANEVEISEAIAEFGDAVSVRVPTVKYEGPVGDRIFIGDIFPEAGFLSLQQSGYIIESAMWDLDRLAYWMRQTTKNAATGEELPVIDRQRAEEVIDATKGRSNIERRDRDLRQQLRQAISQSEPEDHAAPRLPKHRFLVDERHVKERNGVRVDFVAEESIHLGTLWYPWDTYGRYIYTELVLIPDLLGGIGDATPRVSRFLMQLRNTRANQTTDYLNNVIRGWGTVRDMADITAEDLVTTAFGRFVKVKEHDDLRWREFPQFPQPAWQDQAQLVREMQQVEPAASDFASGTEAVPQPGKLATGLVLQARATDTIVQDELAQINIFLKELLELRLWMTQQALEEPFQVEPGDSVRVDALSIRSEGGEAVPIRIDPLEIQEDFEIVPEAGSTLAVDDEFKRAGLERAFLLGAAHPDVFNKRVLGEKLLGTIPGVDTSEAMAPEQEGPQLPEVRANLSVQAKWAELATDVQVALLGGAGLPTEGTAAKGQIKELAEELEDVDRAANAVVRLEGPAEQPEQEVGAGRRRFGE